MSSLEDTIGKWKIKLQMGRRYSAIHIMKNPKQREPLKSKMKKTKLRWWFSGQHSVLPMQGAWVLSLVRKLDLTCCT